MQVGCCVELVSSVVCSVGPGHGDICQSMWWELSAVLMGGGFSCRRFSLPTVLS